MYGENTALLRKCLSELLAHHRIQYRIGAARPPTVRATTTPKERTQIGEQVARYRHGVLAWCHQGMFAATPHIGSESLTGPTHGPAEELRHRLHTALTGDHSRLPALEELTTTQSFRLVELWRQAARACALGEHDFAAGVEQGRISQAQTRTLIHDVAQVTLALLALDLRYRAVPGWQHLKSPTRLARAAEDCATHSRYSDPSYSIDHHGWQPPAQLIDGPGRPGIAGVVQAQHNLLLHLDSVPNAHNLRVIIDSQRLLSHEVATRITDDDPERTALWTHREQVYGSLVRQTRDLGGVLGTGGLAAGQGALAASRIQKLPHNGLTDPAQRRKLEDISARIDGRVGKALRYGITKHLYFERVSALGLQVIDGVTEHVIRKRYVPITSPLNAELAQLATIQLSAQPTRTRPRPGDAESRIDFTAALHHRPGNRGPSLAM